MKQLLIEIGTEEVPASFLEPAALDLEKRVGATLAAAGIECGPARRLFTPRRLALIVSGLPDEKPGQLVEVQGPPRKAAYDAQANPTKTALGFSAAHGKTPADLYVRETPRGEYVFLKKQTEPLPLTSILEQNLPGIVGSLPFPKNMRWDASGTRFARPVRWLVCLFGSEPVRFRFGELEAGRETRGLRHAGPTSFSIPSADAYEETLKKHGIIPDPVARRAAIEAELAKLAASVSGEPVPDEVLLTEATGITESPELLLCSYDRAYLDLPAEVLVTSFREHQRCFAIRKTGDSPPERSARGTVPVLPLLPHFVAVTNTPGCDHRSVTGWYEKAAESRLRDARFFVESDLKRGLEALVADEKQVVWIEGMGSYFDKTERLRALCRHLAAQVPDADASALDRAALLCKADLLTNMVREKEFTSLQGRMGGIYARLLGELEPVARAIAEHYLPNYSGDELPKTREGALLSIADKLDNIVATFLTGEIPTGSEDPFALRRQATGLLTVILERRLPVDVAALVRAGVAQFGNPKPEHAAQIPGLFRERLNALLADQGTPYDVASAVMETSWQEPAQAILRATALTAYRARPEFEKLIIGQKRVANILKGLPRLSAEENRGCTEPQDALLTEPTEKLLWREARTVEPDLDRCLAAHDYSRAFELLLSLRPTIDRFFDDVLVMAEDKEQRANRLSLLNCVRNLFGKVADLSRIVIAGE